MIALSGVSARYGAVRVLEDVTLTVPARSVTGLVGESGSGKSTLLRVIAGLMRPITGQVEVAGTEARGLSFRRRVQMLLQDASGSLSPRMTVRRLLAEPGLIHGLPPPPGDLVARLGLTGLLDRYPHQLSGGQARRVAVARVFHLAPALLLADEPTAGLDVSVQGEVLNLLMEQHRAGLTILIASHNLNVIRRISGQVVVMYLGEIVETAATAALFAAPAHPYSAALLSANPAIDPARRRPRLTLSGDIPSVIAPPSGCRFHTRCFQAQPRCRSEHPALRPLTDARSVRCHFPMMPA